MGPIGEMSQVRYEAIPVIQEIGWRRQRVARGPGMGKPLGEPGGFEGPKEPLPASEQP